MSKKLEKHIENQIKRYLDSLGSCTWHMKVHGSMYQKAGVPDILACINGKFVGIEVKRPGGIVAPLQDWVMYEIRRAGGVAFVAYSVDDVKKQLRQLHVV